MLNIGEKIYYLDYEKSNSSYTIVKIEKDYYVVHSDSLPYETGYYSILIDSVDNDNIADRFYSTKELAREGYLKFKEWVKNKEAEKIDGEI